MKSYLGLIPRYERVHRKNNRISVLCIALSVCLVMAVFSMADMAVRSQKNYFIKTGGEYHAALHDVETETAEQISARVDVALSGWVCQGSTGMLSGKTVSFVGAEEEIMESLTEMDMTDGAYPSLPDEALLNESAMEQWGLSIGDNVTVTVPDGSQKQYRITGVLADMGSMLKADICGMALSEEGFLAIADENAADGTTYRIQFKEGTHIQEAIKEIKAQLSLSDGQISENTALLGLMGQSESNIMQALYLIAAILVFLVLVAGTVMISASFHTNVLERTRVYGLLRCLGASRKQVRHFVILQGLRQSAKGVPAGLLAGQIVTWAACLLLRSISGDRFSEVPLFEFSIAGILAGVVVGFLIVLLAALSPAKKASRVSPVTAVSGGSQLAQNKRAANTKLFRVETGMGVFHALSGKKNLFLMTCSFAISIMLFLAFQVMVVFLDQGMPALAPWAGDVSVTAAAGLEPSVIGDIREIKGVKRAFGRMEYSGLSVSSDTESGTATLVSYEENQFKWAEEELNEGNAESVPGGTGEVLVTYREGMQWKAGDAVTLHTPLGEKQVRIAGILSSANASSEAGSLGYIICSEHLFTESIGMAGYTSVDIQLADSGSDETVSAIRNLFPPDSSIADKRLSNSESQSSYYTGAVFIYGFLLTIALITVFNIFNSMNASVAARTRQYGVMRSIGMGAGQLYRMIAAEAATYAVLGCVTGCVLGIPLNKMMFQFLIAGKWGTGWQLPAASLLLIVVLCFGSAALAIRRPIRKIGKLSIVDTIKLQQ
ncbi:MAG: FtsX-like permease family protein [Lachnospiraceae bacterium]|uniref:ABC transporter permease n=1 Tax=uncultured Acetatifactor sp. TaxID=1671927 RepID=UPI0026050972|nr:FtsX-like permease family protein [uncultured Acetatifactor sp.]MCI8789448.1 FtsX-like permease family protein [Lachnospiraceae bacterium]